MVNSRHIHALNARMVRLVHDMSRVTDEPLASVFSSTSTEQIIVMFVPVSSNATASWLCTTKKCGWSTPLDREPTWELDCLLAVHCSNHIAQVVGTRASIHT